MNKHNKSIIFLLLIWSASIAIYGQAKKNKSIREKLLMDFNWRFAFGHATDFTKDFDYATGYFTHFAKTGYGKGAAAANYEDRTWRVVNLPHDWAVELPFSSEASHSHGYKTIGFKYPETSVGWYRKTFFISNDDLGKKLSIQFDGIHRDAQVWVNGFYVGHELSGSMSAVYDITNYLNYGGNNVIAVRVDASIEEGWYYEGAGIYRHVWLNKTNPLYVAQYGTFVTSEIGNGKADITIRTTVENKLRKTANFSIEQQIVDAEGKVIATSVLSNLSLNHELNNMYYQKTRVSNPKLWSIDDPYMHKLITIVKSEGRITDTYETPFGIRTVRFDPDSGFFLNEKNIKIVGTNVHQDHAGVGTAMPDALQEFRVKQLKMMGSNAIRTSHHPATPELLDACDRLGMLVLNENRLMGINQEHFDLVKRMIVRDRNHPSVFLWSLGNEEWSIEGNEKGERIARTMQDYAQTLDSSRAFTVAVSGGWDWGIGKSVQVMGYNYIVQGNIDEHHAKFPWQCGIGTEESNTIGTRGVYTDERANGHMVLTNRMPENVGTESGWQFYAARPFLVGLFYWTGFDYRGEPNPLGWPAVSSQFGLLDMCGFPKDISYYLKSWWGKEPVLYIAPHWNWKGDEGKSKKVIVYSNCDEVELFVNGKSQSKKTMPVNGHLEWDVIYQPGTIMAKGYKSGKMIVESKNETTDTPKNIALVANKTLINADGEDILAITVSSTDNKGRIVPDVMNEIEFSITGPAKIIGVGNGDPASHEPDKFVETIARIGIQWSKINEIDTTDKTQYFTDNTDISSWKDAFIGGYGLYRSEKNIVVKGSFELQDFNNSTEITFYAKSVTENQSVYVNGVLISSNVKRDEPNQVYLLNHSILKKGINSIGKPFVKRQQWEEISTDPGLIKVLNPAHQWKRKLFNGYAQVIVQSTKQTGEITLTAKSDSLKTGVIKLNSQVSTSRPCIE